MPSTTQTSKKTQVLWSFLPPEQTQLLNLVSHSTKTPYTVQTDHANKHPLIDIVLNTFVVSNTSISSSLRIKHASVQLGCLIIGGLCKSVPQGRHGQPCGAPRPGT